MGGVRRRGALTQNVYWSPPSVPAGKLLLRVEEAAELLGLSRTRVFNLIAEGELAAVKIGGSRRIPRQAIEAFVEGLRAGAGPGPSSR